MSNAKRAMLNGYGYVDRRDQSQLAHEDRLSPLTGAVNGDASCPGCAGTPCGCGRTSTMRSRRPEAVGQAKTWETTKQRYRADGFCEPCSVQAAYGHQFGFSQVAPVCFGCRGRVPTWRRVGDEAAKWAGSAPEAVVATSEAA